MTRCVVNVHGPGVWVSERAWARAEVRADARRRRKPAAKGKRRAAVVVGIKVKVRTPLMAPGAWKPQAKKGGRLPQSLARDK
jgi:hypothetical protein